MALVECSNHYARNMSGRALLSALIGARFDPTNGDLNFSPGLGAFVKGRAFQRILVGVAKPGEYLKVVSVQSRITDARPDRTPEPVGIWELYGWHW